MTDLSNMPIVKAKQALLDAGRIKEIGRGRISLENHKWLADQNSNGRRFSDWPKGKVTEATVTKGEVQTQVVRVVKDAAPVATETAWLAADEYRFPEAEYKAVTLDGKTTFGMREACNNCHLSLVAHICENPSVLGVPVKIVTKK